MAALPAEMTAIEITEPGGPEVLKPGKRPMPLPGAGEVLINEFAPVPDWRWSEWQPVSSCARSVAPTSLEAVKGAGIWP